MQHTLDDFIDRCRTDVAHWRDILDRMEQGVQQAGAIHVPDDTAETIGIFRKMIGRVEIDIERAELLRGGPTDDR